MGILWRKGLRKWHFLSVCFTFFLTVVSVALRASFLSRNWTGLLSWLNQTVYSTVCRWSDSEIGWMVGWFEVQILIAAKWNIFWSRVRDRCSSYIQLKFWPLDFQFFSYLMLQLLLFPQIFPNCIYQQLHFANKRRLKWLLNHKPELWRNN